MRTTSGVKAEEPTRPKTLPEARTTGQPVAVLPQERTDRAESDPATARPSRLNPIKLRRMKERQGEIEEEVTKLEVEIADYEAALGNYVSAEETKRLSELLGARRGDLESLLGEWEEVAQLIEANQ